MTGQRSGFKLLADLAADALAEGPETWPFLPVILLIGPIVWLVTCMLECAGGLR
jgi:hypothetical protein